MRFIGEMLLAVFVGSLVGLGVGYLAYGRGHTAAEFVAPAAAPLAPPALAAALVSAEHAAGVPSAAAPAADSLLTHEVVLPPSLPSHGQGHFFIVDLRAAQMKSLAVHQGALAKDGPGEFGKLLNAKKIGTLRGPRATVELLHFGTDKEGLPIVAHVRTTEKPPVEGVIALVVENKRLTLVEDAARAPLMPTPSPPLGEAQP